MNPLELTVPIPRDDDPLATLAQRAHAGHAGAFDELARRVRDRVRRWASSVTLDEDDAEDVAQQVLLTLHARTGEFGARSRFTTWVYAITRNVALARRRTEARRRALLARVPNDAVTAPTADALGDDAAARLADLVHLVSVELTPRQREVFELADVHGLTSTEIGRRLGVTPSTARGILLQARRAIRLRILEHHAALLKEYRS